MNIARKDSWTCVLKTKNVTVEAGREIRIGGVTISGPGEYDVSEVAIQGLHTTKQTIYVMSVEEMRVCVVPQVPEELSSEMIDKVGGVDIAIVPVVATGAISDTMAMINTLEPRMAILIGDGDMSSVPQSGSTQTVKDVKVTNSLLPVEDRQLVVLQ